jgi:hypothetical protein
MADRPPRTIRFIRAELDNPADDRCRAVVQIERPDSGLFSGTAEGPNGPGDQLRAVARAAGDAVTEAFKSDGVSVRVRGVLPVEAFGQTVVVVSVAATAKGRNQTLLGVCDGGTDTSRAAALAVLNATNRFIGSG